MLSEVTLLLVMLVSFSLPVTLAKLGIVPLVNTLTINFNVTDAPLVMFPMVHFPVALS